MQKWLIVDVFMVCVIQKRYKTSVTVSVVVCIYLCHAKW